MKEIVQESAASRADPRSLTHGHLGLPNRTVILSNPMLRRGIPVLLAVVLLAACGGNGGAEAPSEVTGVIILLDTDETGSIKGFSLRADAETYEIRIAEDVNYGFDLAHLNEHMTTGDPVRCRLEERDGDLYALTIEDAPTG